MFKPQDFFNTQLGVLAPSDAAHKTIKKMVKEQITGSFTYDGKRETWSVRIYWSCIAFLCKKGLSRYFEYKCKDENTIDSIWNTQDDIINHIFNQ